MTHGVSGPRALSAAVARVTRFAFARRGFADGAVITDWPAIVGPHLAARTLPERIVRAGAGRGEGVLHLRADGGALAIELLHLEPQLVERINTYFGCRAVARIRIVQGPVAGPPPTVAGPTVAVLDAVAEQALARAVAPVADEALRRALAGLGRAVAAVAASE